MFIRGGLFNDWNATKGNRFSDQGEGIYIARLTLAEGSFEWKVADADWSLEYCTPTSLVADTPTVAPLFGCTFPVNGSINVPATGCYEFRMQGNGVLPANQVELTFFELVDTDLDNVLDIKDNCTQIANPDQRDTDGDGIGNACDPDVAVPNDCTVDLVDLAAYRENFLVAGDLDTDNNGDGQTDLLDLSFVRAFFLAPPGPSASGCN